MLPGAQFGIDQRTEKGRQRQRCGAQLGRVAAEHHLAPESRVVDEQGFAGAQGLARRHRQQTSAKLLPGRHGSWPQHRGDTARRGDGVRRAEVAVRQRLDLAARIQAARKGPNLGQREVARDRQQFVGPVVEFAHRATARFLQRHIRIDAIEGRQLTQQTVFQRGVALGGQGAVAQAGQDFIEQAPRRRVVAVDAERDAFERGAEVELQAGLGGGVGGLVQGLLDAGLVEVEQRRVAPRGHVARQAHAHHVRDQGALKLGVLGVVQAQGGLVDQPRRLDRQHLGPRGHIAVGCGQAHRGQGGRSLQCGPRGAGVFRIAVARAEVSLRLVGRQALGHQGHQQVVGAQQAEQSLHRGQVLAQPEIGHAFSDLDRMVHQLVGQGRGQARALTLVTESLVEGRHRPPLAEHMRRHTVAPQVVDRRKHHGQHARILVQALRRQVHRHVKGTVVRRVGVGADRQAGGEARLLQRRQQAARTFGAEHEGHQFGRLAAGIGAQIGQRETQGHAPQVVHRLQAQQAQCGLGRQVVGRVAQFGALLVGHGHEVAARQGLELIQAARSSQGQRHAIRAVVALMKGQQLLARRALEGVAIADAEIARRMAGPVSGIAQRVLAPAIVLKVLLEFRMHRVDLALVELGRELRGNEELRKAVDRPLEGPGLNLQVIVGAIACRVGIAVAPIALQVLVELGHRRVLLRAQEQHVFEVVSQALARRWVTQAANPDGHGGGRHVELGV